MKRRSRLELFATLIKRVSLDQLTTNRIMLLENLSGKLTRDLLSHLQACGFVIAEEEGQRRVYKATSTGLEFLMNYAKVLQMLEQRH